MLSIGIDPSLTNTGLAAIDVDAGRVVAWKCIRTEPDAKLKPTEDLARRLILIASEVAKFCTQHRGVIVVEGQVGSSFGKGSSQGSTGLLMAAYGATLGALPTKPVVLHSATVKSRLLKGQKFSSTKEAKMAAWIAAKEILSDFPEDPKTKAALEAVHDAVATAIAGMPELRQVQALLPSQAF